MAIRKKKLGERVGNSLTQLKGDDDKPQIFSLVSPDVLSYDYHYDDVFESLGKVMCMSEYDENGKMLKKAECCKIFKKKQERVLLLVISYEGSKKKYRQYGEGKIKYLSITGYKYNDLCKQLDEAGVDFEDAANGACDLVLKSEDAAHGKINFEVIDSGEKALWVETPELKDLVKEARETWEEEMMATLPPEYSPEEFKRLIEEAREEAREEGKTPEGVEDVGDDIPRKKKKRSEDDEDETPKKKKSRNLDDNLDEELDSDEEETLDDEDETPKKKKKSVREQIEEEDFDNFDNEELDSDEEETLDDEDETLDDEDETPKKKKKRYIEDDEDEDE